jgi:hypothetical protein
MGKKINLGEYETKIKRITVLGKEEENKYKI